jgi:hypothetical protein
MPEAVVRPPALGIGEHLVRLRDGAEPKRRVGRLAHVGVELARKPTERSLDVGVARVPRDAEQLVVVLLGRRHHAGPYTSSTNRESSKAAARTARMALS